MGERGELQPLEERTIFETSRSRDGKEVLRLRFVRAMTPDQKEVAWHDLREWWKGDDGEFRPGKKGISIRGRELGPVVVALLRATATSIPRDLHGAAKQIVDAIERAGNAEQRPAAPSRPATPPQRMPDEEYRARRGMRR